MDSQQRVVAFTEWDERLFFGKTPIEGCVITESVGEEVKHLARPINTGVKKALKEQRNVSFIYRSISPDGITIRVCAHLRYDEDDTLRLDLIPLHEDDLLPEPEETQLPSGISLQTIFNDLPIGIEVYDREGRLIEINVTAITDAGVKQKEDILGTVFFNNPNFPDNVKERLRAGKHTRFHTNYDFKKIRQSRLYNTQRNDVCSLEVSVSVLRDAAGGIDKYIFTYNNVTQYIRLKQQYERLYIRNSTILNSLSVAVGLYSAEGRLFYANDKMYRVFGIDPAIASVNTTDMDPILMIPIEVKQAILDRVPVQIHFPYHVEQEKSDRYSLSRENHTIWISCDGQPILDSSGQMESYVCIMDDITEKIRSEEERRENRLKTEIAMKAADIMLWEYDVKKEQFFSDNEPINDFNRTIPITREQYIQTTHPDDQAHVVEYLNRMTSGEDFMINFDLRVILPNHSEYQYCSVSGSISERDKEGRVIKYVGIRKNITGFHKQQLLREKILDSIPLSIHIKDVANDYRYLFCNEESKKLFGTSVDKTTYDVMADADVERIRKTDLEVYKTGIPYLGSERVILKDGRTYDTIVRKSIVEENGERLLLTTRWDQSLQKELQRRSKILSLSLEAMNAFTWFYEPDIRRINFGDEFDKGGRSSAEVNTLERFIERLHPDDVIPFIQSLQEAVDKETGKWHTEYRFDDEGNGVFQWWECCGTVETAIINDVPVKYMFGMTIYIEPYKQTEMSLRQKEEELSQLIRQNELILNNINSGLAYITIDYVVQWENISVCSTSLSYEAYKKGEYCYKSAHNRTSPCEDCVLQRTIQSGLMEQIQFVLSNNRSVEVFATPVYGKDNTIDGVVIRVDDITERETTIEELKQAKILAEQSDKLKSAFLANMSHEIRTPLNAIVGFSELLMTTTDESDKEEYINIISNNNDLLLKLINDILDLSKIEAGSVELRYEEFDLAEYFSSMGLSMRQRVTSSNVKLIVKNPYSKCLVHLDRNRIAQLITNFVTNSIKFTPRGFIEMGYEQEVGGICFYVKDSGIGIPDEKKNKVFQRFAKLDEFAQGTGLGLSICKAIAESMGGRVGFESQYGEGAIFWAFLPCDPIIETNQSALDDSMSYETVPADSTALLSQLPESGPINMRKTILVAEDIDSNYLLIEVLLRKRFNLLHAKNGKKAVEMAQNYSVDLVLMDMKMPVMNGLEATIEIRRFNRNLPIVALTAHAFESDRIAVLNAGCNDYLVKPIDKTRLMAVLKKYCRETL